MERRNFVKYLLGSSTLILSYCASPKKEYQLEQVTDCADLTGLSEDELEKRKSLGYEEETPVSDNRCDNCQLYLPPTEKRKCGGCQLFKGPVKAGAYCTYWAPRVDNA
ncbi:high-potential iron-sulfur protein [Cyclobacterium sp.]|uniref:high-potential iron-sulfur protein n=1 Tax=Cyclobacterium sp. TaxID=1966343 RepID=UPI001988DF62|nr:high-potential iron-sulfur protein [Cyclobacterium sp.]MBD3628800.1 high-potential iron-sulfur protein [Cyclobacterium sp.]